MSRWSVHHAEVLDALAKLEDNSFDALISDVPYGLGSHQPTAEELVAYINGAELDLSGDFMGKDWQVPSVRVWREIYRVLKPGAPLLVYGGTRTIDLITIGMRAAGFTIKDQLQYLYGCLSEDTELLVEGEWKHFADARVGDRAMSFDIATGAFAWSPIKQTFVYEVDDVLFRLQSDDTDQLVTSGHRCVVDRGQGLEFRFAEAIARECEARVPVLKDLHRLLGDVPLPQRSAGDSKQDLQSRVRAPSDLHVASRAREKDPAGGSCGHGEGGLHALRSHVLACQIEPQASEGSTLLASLQRTGEATRARSSCAQRRAVLDQGVEGAPARVHDGAIESGVEGRGHYPAPTRELWTSALCSSAGAVSRHGEEGRIRHGASSGRCDGDREMLDLDRGGASREPRSDGQPRREPGALCLQSRSQALRGAWPAETTLVRVEPERYRGLVWCIQVSTGAFVARRNGKVFVTGNSGFPKSLDASKALDSLALRRWLSEHPVESAWYVAAQDWIRESDQTDEYARGMVEAIETEAGAHREELEMRHRALEGSSMYAADAGGGFREDFAVTAPATPLAVAWQGWGTALKPAVEPVVLGFKPVDGTIAENIERWGVGAIAIDECRIGYISDEDKAAAAAAAAAAAQRACRDQNEGRTAYGRFDNGPASLPGFFAKQDAGRWPSNVLMSHSERCLLVSTRPSKDVAIKTRSTGKVSSQNVALSGPNYGRTVVGSAERPPEEIWECEPHCPIRMLDEQAGNRPGMSGGGKHSADYAGGMFGKIDSTHTARGDSGGPSRFFFTAKASRRERELGCEHLPRVSAGEMTDRDEDEVALNSPRTGAGRTNGSTNPHPTLKPIAIGRYLATLLLPPAARPQGPRRLLVPYAGSGSEMVAALLAGWDDVVGIEREPRTASSPDYVSILKARCAFAEANPRAYDPDAPRKKDVVLEGQTSLFGAAE